MVSGTMKLVENFIYIHLIFKILLRKKQQIPFLINKGIIPEHSPERKVSEAYTRIVRKIKNVCAYNPRSCFIVPDQSCDVFSRV